MSVNLKLVLPQVILDPCTLKPKRLALTTANAFIARRYSNLEERKNVAIWQSTHVTAYRRGTCGKKYIAKQQFEFGKV